MMLFGDHAGAAPHRLGRPLLDAGLGRRGLLPGPGPQWLRSLRAAGATDVVVAFRPYEPTLAWALRRGQPAETAMEIEKSQIEAEGREGWQGSRVQARRVRPHAMAEEAVRTGRAEYGRKLRDEAVPGRELTKAERALR